MAKKPAGKLAVRAAARRNVMRRARREGGVWTILAIAWFGARTLSKMAHRKSEVVYQQPLAAGEAISISHTSESRGDLAKRQATEKRRAKEQAKVAKAAAKAENRR